MSLIRNFLAVLLLFVSSVCLAGPVNINTADAGALASLKGVGPAKAAAIIADRDANGSFSSVDDLMRVKGIGKQTVEINRNMMTVTGESAE